MKKLNKTNNKNKKSAFTLAEVVITLAIIGIISVIVLPQLVTNVQEKAQERAANVFMRRMGEALKIMNQKGTLANNSTTANFVTQLSKRYKVEGTCNGTKLTDCFATTFRDSTGKEYETTLYRRAHSLNSISDYGDTTVMGIVFSGGISGLIAYNEHATQDRLNNEHVQITNSGTVKDSQIGISTDAMTLLFDLNGKAGPNIMGKDIRGINISLAGCPGTVLTIEGQTYCNLATTYPAYGTFDYNGTERPDKWTGAKKTCEKLGGSLLSLDTLSSLKGKPGAPASGNYWSTSETSETHGTSWNFTTSKAVGSLKSSSRSAICSGNF